MGYPSQVSILLCQVSDRYRVRYTLHSHTVMHHREEEAEKGLDAAALLL